MTRAMSSKILMVDDERNVRLSYRAALDTEGYDLTEAEGGVEALAILPQAHFDLAILDLRMPGMDGLVLLAAMRKQGNRTPAMMITAHGEVPHAVQALKLGAIDFLQKPLTPTQLRRVVGEVLGRHQARVSRPVVNTATLDPAVSSEQRFEICLSEAKRLLNLQQFEAARDLLAEAMSLNPLCAEAFNLAGVLFELLGEQRRAMKFYLQSTKLDQSSQPAQQNLRRIKGILDGGSSVELPYGRR